MHARTELTVCSLHDRGTPRTFRLLFVCAPTLEPEIVDGLLEAGIHRIVFSLPPANADTVLPILDEYAEFKAQYA